MYINSNKYQHPSLFECLRINMLRLFIKCNTHCIGNHSPHQTRLNTNPKTFKAIIPVNLFGTIYKSSISKPFVRLVSAWLWNLKHCFDYVLRIWKDPAVDSSNWAHEHTLQDGKSCILFGDEEGLSFFICSELCSIGKYLSKWSGKEAFK